MQIASMKLSNFRSFSEEVQINFDDLTAFVGKNDIGKSTILEALDIFLNDGKGNVKLDKDDINKQTAIGGNCEISISLCFKNLPNSIIIDDSYPTTLQEEHLLNSENQLEIVKKYPRAGAAKVFVKAYHPTNSDCKDLLLKKDSDLRAIIEQKNIDCENRVAKSIMRKAIWNHYDGELQLADVELDITKGDTKTIWEKLQNYLPTYTLFQADRKNCDGDAEIQDPLKEAVKSILGDAVLRAKLADIAAEVENKLQDVSERTMEKLRELNPSIANSLNPIIPPTDNLKWADVFKSVSISGDEDIPINKRGSGTKRLILLSFFRAEAERRRTEADSTGIIYAIEEPETSQHAENQKLLIYALKELAQADNTQVILTTHNANIVKQLNFANLRLVSYEDEMKTVKNVLPNNLPYPSLNEVNYIAFKEITEEYHNELYGWIESEGQLGNYKTGKATMPYIKLSRSGNEQNLNLTLTEYIRHQIHHPENTLNDRFTYEQLKESIELMREFINNMGAQI